MFLKSWAMRSNYKKLGQFIREVSVKNKDFNVELLLGVSITKKFIPSIANTVGTDMSKYKVVEHHQFAYGPVTSRNGEKISVALLDEERCIVSTSYTVFEIVDTEQLDPEYLMMWFRRTEFDRYARYMSHGTVRELFGWQDMCDVELPVPSIEKQREIVCEYNVVNDRIALNEQLTQRLEDTAHAIYKQWFVDFEFPISREYAESIGKPELEGKSYKSSDGEMEYCEKREQDVPKGWKSKAFTELFDLKGGGTPSTDIKEYWGGDIPFFTPKDVTRSFFTISTLKSITDKGFEKSSTKKYPAGTTFITARGTVGAVSLASVEMAMNQSCYAVCAKANKFESSEFIHQHSIDAINVLKNEAIGGVFGALVTRDFDGCYIISPSYQITNDFGVRVKPLYKLILLKQKENDSLRLIISLLMSKLTRM